MSRCVFRQRARSPEWVYLAIGSGAAAFALPLVPGSWSAAVPWALALLVLGWAFGRWGWTLPSWVTEDATGERMLHVQERHATIAGAYPVADITAVEPCTYAGWRGPVVPDDLRDAPFHNVRTQPGYSGPGVVVRYTLSVTRGGDGQARSVQFPAPEAERLLELLRPAAD